MNESSAAQRTQMCQTRQDTRKLYKIMNRMKKVNWALLSSLPIIQEHSTEYFSQQLEILKQNRILYFKLRRDSLLWFTHSLRSNSLPSILGYVPFQCRIVGGANVWIGAEMRNRFCWSCEIFKVQIIAHNKPCQGCKESRFIFGNG